MSLNDQLRDALDQMAKAQADRDRLRLALEDAHRWMRAYMKYHEETFYSPIGVKPTGLWPAIQRAAEALETE